MNLPTRSDPCVYEQEERNGPRSLVWPSSSNSHAALSPPPSPTPIAPYFRASPSQGELWGSGLSLLKWATDRLGPKLSRIRKSKKEETEAREGEDEILREIQKLTDGPGDFEYKSKKTGRNSTAHYCMLNCVELSSYETVRTALPTSERKNNSVTLVEP